MMRTLVALFVVAAATAAAATAATAVAAAFAASGYFTGAFVAAIGAPTVATRWRGSSGMKADK